MNKQWISIIGATIAFGLAGCGSDSASSGGSSDSLPTSSTIFLSGVVATGAPLVGFVAVKDSAGNVSTANIDAQGKYSVDTSNLRHL